MDIQLSQHPLTADMLPKIKAFLAQHGVGQELIDDFFADENLRIAASHGQLEDERHDFLAAMVRADFTPFLNVPTLKSLTPDQFTALILHEGCGFKYREIAPACGCPVNTVRTRISRGRDALDPSRKAESQQRKAGRDSVAAAA